MADNFNDIMPIGGMDMDSEARSLAKMDYAYGLNLRNAVNSAARGKSMTNIKGTIKIGKYTMPYSGGTSLPIGTNRCIGAFEDDTNKSVIFFVWNSHNKHSILRYYREQTDIDNPYGVVEQIISYNFGWTIETRITSASVVYGDDSIGELLYWLDPVPKKINLTKANICTKKKSWTVLLPSDRAGESFFYQIVVKDFSTGGNVGSANINIPPNLSLNDMLDALANQINANLGTYITATACDCKVTIVENSINKYNLLFTSPAFLLIPENWYGLNLIDRFFDRCVWPDTTAPVLNYRQDTNWQPNFVKNKVFQGRLQYIGENVEETTFGIWSQVPINNLTCNGANNDALNYIDILFSDPNLSDPNTYVILKKIKVIIRELNTGKDKIVVELEPCEFIGYNGASLYAHYKFYNNIIANTANTALAAKQYDNIALTAGAEVFSKNRLITADITEGYDAPACADADYKIQIQDSPNTKLYKILGIARVFNQRLDNNTIFPPRGTAPNILERAGQILYDSSLVDAGVTAYPYYGGVTVVNSSVNINAHGAYFDKRQILPEGGFVFYTAGQNYYGISRQISVGSIPARNDGSFDISTTTNKDSLKALVTAQTDVYSTFEILVPPGEYVIRMASHWCSFGDKLGKGYMYDLNNGSSYQQTSGYVWGVNDYPLGGAYRYDFEIKVTVTNADVFIGEFIISDLAVSIDGDADPNSMYPSNSGYLFDANGSVDAQSLASGVTVEGALVRNKDWGATYSARSYMLSLTDHNGFWVVPIAYDAGSNVPKISNAYYVFETVGPVRTGGPNYYENIIGYSSSADDYSALYLLYTNSIGSAIPQDGTTIPSHIEFIICTDTPTARAQSSTFVNGNVLSSNGDAQSGVSVTLTHGRTVLTDANGAFSLIAWGDMRYSDWDQLYPSNPFHVYVKKRIDYLIYQLSVICIPSYPNGQEAYVEINPFGVNPNEYNPNYPYIAADFILDEAAKAYIKALKRGGNYLHGIRYSDNPGRLCSVVPLFETYIPHQTEDLGTYPHVVDSGGNPYSLNTYLGGKPSINILLNYDPPTWAVTYEILRSKNLVYGRYLEWVTNSVTYLSAMATYSTAGEVITPEIRTVYTNGNATFIKISITNIIEYSRTNANSQVSYTYSAGDRLRLVNNNNLELINGLYDFEVTSYDTSTQELYIKAVNIPFEIKAGFTIEIYRLKSVADDEQQIYYEVGEVFFCTAPNTTNNKHSITNIALTNGDTYWRGRTIAVNDDNNNFASVYPVVIEDASVSDFYPSLAEDIGRVGVVDPNFKRLHNPTLMRFSNQFLAIDNSINGLSSIESENYLELDRAYGAIQQLIFTQNTLVIVGSTREISQYLGQTTIQQGNTVNAGLVALSDSFFGAPYVHSRLMGTDHKGSVVPFDGAIFGVTGYLGNAWRYQGDGENVISDVNMLNYFQGLSESGIKEIVSVFDRFNEEYILTVWREYKQQATVTARGKLPNGYSVTVTYPNGAAIPELNSTVEVQYLLSGKWVDTAGLVTGIIINSNDTYSVTISTAANYAYPIGSSITVTYALPETLAWFNGTDAIQGDRWTTFRSYTPEMYASLGSEVFGFQNGEIHIFDKNPIRNNFFGVQYESSLSAIFNDNPRINKVFQALWLLQYQDNKGCNWRSDYITNSLGQLSRIKNANFVRNESYWCVPFAKDLTDTTVAIPILDGRELRDSYLRVDMQNNHTGEIVLYSWLGKYIGSERIPM